MSNCERCGKELPETAAICPSCGTISSYSRPGMTFSNEYGINPPSGPGYTQGYGPQPQPLYPQQQPQQIYPPQQPQQSNEYGMNSPSGPNYTQDYSPQQPYSQPQQMYVPQQPGYGQIPPGMYPPISVNINVMAGTPVAQPTNSTPILVEVLLSVFLGIYGVGWLMAGETTTGIVLLICSILIYWPLIILGIFGTILTLGLGLVCIGPLAIVAIVMNAVLLSNRLKRKASYIIVPPMQPMPPQRMRPQ